MDTLGGAVAAYKVEMQKGQLPRAYRGIMQFLMDLRSRLAAGKPDHFVSGSL